MKKIRRLTQEEKSLVLLYANSAMMDLASTELITQGETKLNPEYREKINTYLRDTVERDIESVKGRLYAQIPKKHG